MPDFAQNLLAKVILLFILIIADVFSTSAQNRISLTESGKSKFKIVLSVNANQIEKRAAEVLQYYFHKVTTFKLPITNVEGATSTEQLIVGRNKLTSTKELEDLGEDGIIIKQSGNTIVLNGGPGKGALYAVYSFLQEYLGCEGYTSSDIEVPTKTTLVLTTPVYKKERPSFKYRLTNFPDALNYEYCDWRKLNYPYENWGLWIHSFETLLPKAQYFTTHPEYYALINGKRNPVQLNLSNPAVLKIVTENLRKMMQAKPGAIYWSVSQNDTNTNEEHCECDDCKKLDKEQGSPQGSLLSFVNSVARSFPDKIIATLAYGYSEKPPSTLRPEKNVMIMLTATSISDRSKAISTQDPIFNSNLKKWGSITDHLFLWDYTVQFEHSILPFPNIQTLQPNIQLFAANNVKYVFEQGISKVSGEFSELRSYLLSKLMWNKNVNVQETINKFNNYYYGKAGATYINQYLNLLNKRTTGNVLLKTSGNINVSLKTYLSSINIDTYKSVFNRAFTVLDPNSIYGKRVLKEYCGVLYAELESIKSILNNGDKLSTKSKEEYKKLVEDWYAKSKAANIATVNEGQLTIKDYHNSLLPLLIEK